MAHAGTWERWNSLVRPLGPGEIRVKIYTYEEGLGYVEYGSGVMSENILRRELKPRRKKLKSRQDTAPEPRESREVESRQ